MSCKNLYIVRHGNTFDTGEVVCRVGSRTDLPLSKSGQAQLINLAQYIKAHHINIEQIYSSKLLRAQQSAQIINEYCHNNPLNIIINDALTEVDYGIDDGMPEHSVIARIGQSALDAWENNNIVPDGWLITPERIIADWGKFITNLIQQQYNNILLVTSNGVARFLPSALNLTEKLSKLSTGSISHLRFLNNQWQVEFWNKRPIVL